MQMQNAECRTQPKMITLYVYVQHAECRMQDAKSDPQRVCPLGAAHSFEPGFCILHPHPASCIGCKASGFGPDSAFCICILHGVQCTALFGADSMADSAFRTDLYVLYSPHRMQMRQNAECRIGPKAVNCTRCRMQMQNAECRSGPKS